MIQLSRWKVILVVASAIIGCLLAYPNLLSPAQRAALPGWKGATPAERSAVLAKLAPGGLFVDVKSAFERAVFERAGHTVWRL